MSGGVQSLPPPVMTHTSACPAPAFKLEFPHVLLTWCAACYLCLTKQSCSLSEPRPFENVSVTQSVHNSFLGVKVAALLRCNVCRLFSETDPFETRRSPTRDWFAYLNTFGNRYVGAALTSRLPYAVCYVRLNLLMRGKTYHSYLS